MTLTQRDDPPAELDPSRLCALPAVELARRIAQARGDRPRGGRRAPGPDRRGQSHRQRGHGGPGGLGSRRGRPGRQRGRRRTSLLARWPGSRSRSRRTSTWPGSRPPTGSWPSGIGWLRSTRRRSRSCGRPARSPSARTNMPDLGMRWHTDSGLFGATRNPWNAALSPAGSSGGEAVALATGMSPLGIGNDYGGSIRLPSAAAGTVGLRPTAGRVASATSTNPFPPPPTLQLFAVDGPMGRRVEDVRLAYELMCGPDARDPKWVPAPVLQQVPDPIRVAVTTDPGAGGVDAAIAAAVRRAADALADAGAIVEEVDPPQVLESAELWRTLTTAELLGVLDGLIRPLGSADASTYLEQSMAHVARLDLAGYVDGLARRHAIAAAWSAVLRGPRPGPGPRRDAADPRRRLRPGRPRQRRRALALTPAGRRGQPAGSPGPGGPGRARRLAPAAGRAAHRRSFPGEHLPARRPPRRAGPGLGHAHRPVLSGSRRSGPPATSPSGTRDRDQVHTADHLRRDRAELFDADGHDVTGCQWWVGVHAMATPQLGQATPSAGSRPEHVPGADLGAARGVRDHVAE